FLFYPLSFIPHPLRVTTTITLHEHDGFFRFALSSALPSPPRNKLSSIWSEGHHFDVLRIIKTCKFRQEREHDPRARHFSGPRARHFSGPRARLLPHGPRPRSRCTSTIFILLKSRQIQ